MYSTKKGTQSYQKKVYFSDKTTEHGSKVVKQRPADYCKTLVDPWLDMNIRIPDLACYPTSAFKNELNYVWAVTNAGDSSNNSILVVDLAETLGFFHCQGRNGALSGEYTTGTLTPTYIGPQNLYQYYDQFRVVSAGIKVQFADADTATKGIIWASAYPGCSENIQQSTTQQSSPWKSVKAGNPCDLSSQKLLNDQKNVYSGPLVDGCVVRYQPYSSNSFEMIRGTTDAGTNQWFNFGRFVVAVDGLAVGEARTLHVSMVVNIEAIPISANPSQIATAPSPADGIALDAGLNVASQSTPAFSASPGDINSNITSIIRYLNTLR